MYLHEQEDILFEEWKNSYPSDVRENIVIDGLCHNGELYKDVQQFLCYKVII